jgi:hypothetical protein
VSDGAVVAEPLTDTHGALIIVGAVARTFMPDEANEALVEIRPIAERMVERRRILGIAQRRQQELVIRIAGNGGDLSPGEVRDAAATVEREVNAIAECVAALDAAGVQVKDVEEGLLDFPARHAGRDVLLCWKVGEPEVAFWHGADEGFAGRKPLPFVDD